MTVIKIPLGCLSFFERMTSDTHRRLACQNLFGSFNVHLSLCQCKVNNNSRNDCSQRYLFLLWFIDLVY